MKEETGYGTCIHCNKSLTLKEAYYYRCKCFDCISKAQVENPKTENNEKEM